MTLLSSIATKVQISLITLSIVGISFSIYTYTDVRSAVEDIALIELIESHIYWQIAVAIIFNIVLGFLIFLRVNLFQSVGK